MLGMDIPSNAGAQAPIERLTFNSREACQALGVSSTTLWRLEKRGLISSVAGIRTKLYPVAVLRRFVEKGAA
jgi:predicted site-specific integrase-resolvase